MAKKSEIEFTIDKDGKVRNPEVIDIEGPDAFVGAAKAAISRWRFAPRYENGQPVARQAQQEIRFELDPAD